MIVVNLRKSYRDVLSGDREMDDATLGWWADVNDEAVARYGDVVVGVYKDQVVSVYDVTGHERREDGRVYFTAEPSVEFAPLLHRRSPVKPWVRGQARPIQYIDTDQVRHGDAPEEILDDGYRRAVVAGYVLTVDADGIATVEPPEGGVVTVMAAGHTGALPTVLPRRP